ncbi:peptidylprolyl isomerase [Aquifex aeolicus]|uniref:PpiC domain-containing protein n=1 Tax=Aquifex aeolicus (strain VF5) TaxID=224324 RepID=O66854_AQUAE|nr:SurA N-terminal domain-containing protein [Aquifex aeolicus]AAC06821.1 hypothetical protein aq_592 [Aquifex aeolicus VF5]
MFGLIQKHKRIAVIIVTLASLSFLFWMFSVSDVKQMLTGNPCVATVGDECITLREYRFELLKYSNFLQDERTEKLARRVALNSLITKEVLYLKAKELGWYVSDEEVVEVIKNDENFKEKGKFSVEKYRETLNRFGLTPAEYEEIVRKSLMAQRVLNFLREGVYVLPDELDIQKRFYSLRVEGKLYLIKPSDVKVDYEPSEEEIKEYYEKNKEKFKEEEKEVVYVWSLKDKEKVKEYYENLKKGSIPSGYTEFNENLPPKVKEAVKELNQENRIKVVRVGENYYLLYYKGKENAGYKPLEEVKEEIKKELVAKKQREKLKEFAQEVFKNLKEGKEVGVKPLAFSSASLEEIQRILMVEQKDLLNLVFGKEKVYGPYPSLAGYGILVVKNRKFEELKPEQVKEIERELKDNKFNDLAGLFVEKLIKEYGVKVNEQLAGI